jgi:hypothetical protein
MLAAVFIRRDGAATSPLDVPYIVYPVLVWIAMISGPRRTALAAGLTVAVASLATTRGLGPFDDVYEAALALPRAQRAELIELLTSDLTSDDESAFDFAWKGPAEEPSAEIDAGAAEMIPWDEVRRRVSARLTSDE